MFLKIIIILLICDKVCGFTVDEALHYAGCISQCEDKSCRDDCIRNEYRRKKMETSTETAKFNATLHCRDSDLLVIKHNPGTYVIEVGISDKWGEVRVNQGDMSMFSNLYPGTSYRYRVRRIRENIISATEITPWFTTTNETKPAPVERIYVKDILPDDANDLMAEIEFVPAKDPSCFYNVLSWPDDEGLSIGDVNATRGFHFNLRHLPYHRNTTVVFSANNNGSSMSSDNVTLVFKTPTCSEIHENLTICPPDQITGLRVTPVQDYESNCDFIVTWEKPKILPDNYSLEIVTLDEPIDPYIITVPGNTTKVFYSSENVGLRHKISIVAESPGGFSIPASIYNTHKPDNQDSFPALKETVIIFSSIILTAVPIIIVYVYCKYKKSKNCKKPYEYSPTNTNEKAIFNPIYEKAKFFEMENKDDENLLMPKDSFELRPMQLSIKEILGSGFSGVVRLGSLKIDENESIDVAVKMLKDCPSAEDMNNFQHEIMIMKSAGKHRNIVSLIGCCSSDIRPMLVVEYCSKGDLQTYLRNIWENIMNHPVSQKINSSEINKRDGGVFVSNYENHREVAVSNKLYDIQPDMLNRTEDITVADLLSFAVQIANGMEFLSLNRIVHRDLAARNILLCEDGTVKISDFGLSRDIYQENIYKKQGDGKLPLKWMAIEALTHQIYTTQSDVWSFGILLWEIVTLGCNPYPDTPTNMILQVLKTGYRMEKPPSCGQELYDIMLACWRTSPRSRPTFTDLKNNLEKLLQTVSQHEYLNLCAIQQPPYNVNSSN